MTVLAWVTLIAGAIVGGAIGALIVLRELERTFEDGLDDE